MKRKKRPIKIGTIALELEIKSDRELSEDEVMDAVDTLYGLNLGVDQLCSVRGGRIFLAIKRDAPTFKFAVESPTKLIPKHLPGFQVVGAKEIK